MPWHPVPRRAASVYLRAGALTCSLPTKLRLVIKLRSAYILCYFIRNRRWAYIVCIGFLQCGIPRHTCRFYCCLAAHQRTKEKDSAEPLSSILWTLTPHPGGSAAAGHVGCRGFGAILLAEIRCKSIIPSSEFGAVGCVRAGIVRVSVGLLGWYRSFFISGGMDCSFLRLRMVLLFLS